MRLGQPHNRRLACRVHRQPHGGDDPTDAPDVDDGPSPPARGHRGRDLLGQEEDVPEVDRDLGVEEFRGDGGGGTAGVGGGVVDEDVDSWVGGEDGGDGVLEGRDGGEVAVVVEEGGVGDGEIWVGGGEVVDELVGGGVVDVEEVDGAGLLDECCDERGADAGGASGDEDGAVVEGGVDRELGRAG